MKGFATLAFGFIIILTISGCKKENVDNSGFEQKIGSATGDPEAIALAQRVIESAGGKENFDKINFLSFDFFGRRQWFWDKSGHRFRVESEQRKLRAAGKLDGSETKLWLRGENVTDLDTITKYRDFAYKAWINDTYWLLFPFKLLDPGVHLKYLGKCSAPGLSNTTCIELTFDSVGVTPDNKYVAYIDTTVYEIVYWDYYKNKIDSFPNLSNAWNGYDTYDGIKISGGRGDDTIKNIRVYSNLPDRIFRDVSRSYKREIGHITKK